MKTIELQKTIQAYKDSLRYYRTQQVKDPSMGDVWGVEIRHCELQLSQLYPMINYEKER